jgi:hypothetical protein
MTAAEIFSIFKDLCVAGAAVMTAFIAWKGVESWKRELKGKAEFEVARDFIKAAYRLRNAIEICRSPWIYPYEYPEGYPQSKNNRSAQEEGDAKLHIYNNRLKPVDSCLLKFDAFALEAEALWGEEIVNTAHLLRMPIIELKVAIHAVIADAYSGGEDFKDTALMRVTMESVTNSKPEENELTIKINNAIKDIEYYLRPHLARTK